MSIERKKLLQIDSSQFNPIFCLFLYSAFASTRRRVSAKNEQQLSVNLISQKYQTVRYLYFCSDEKVEIFVLQKVEDIDTVHAAIPSLVRLGSSLMFGKYSLKSRQIS